MENSLVNDIPVFIFDSNGMNMHITFVSRAMLMKKNVFLEVGPFNIQRVAVPLSFYNAYTFHENSSNPSLRGIRPILIASLKRAYFTKMLVIEHGVNKKHKKLRRYKEFKPCKSRFASEGAF